MKKILIATDFSAASYNAAKYGADMALTIGADILLLHVYQLPIPTSEVAFVVPEQEIRAEAETRIKALEETIGSTTNKKINVTAEVLMGSFFTQLKTVCERVQPYAVVMGSQGSTAAERILFGSNAVYTMKHLEWPVITVPSGATFSAVKKVGLACDFDDTIDRIKIDEIRKLVKDFNAELHILNTGRETEFNPDVVFESGMLGGMIKDLNPQYHFISSENVDESILEFAEKNSLDLLVVMPKRHSLAEKIFHKSATKQFVLHSHIPVMALHL